ncbi:MAG: tetratricopeptide repeat protein, partial [Bradymonadia bacterium]
VQSAVISEVAHAGLSKRASSPMLADVLKWWPENQFLWLRYTAQLTREQDFESAQNAVDAALTLFGKDPQFVEQKMRILIGKGLYAAALQLGGTLKAADVLQQANILGLMGICAANLKEYQQAKALFNQALELNPNQEESRLSLPRINSILRSNSP